jgi:hypothetical protein
LRVWRIILFAALCGAGLGSGFAAHSDIVHTPTFKVDGKIIVWGGHAPGSLPAARLGDTISGKITPPAPNPSHIVQTAHLDPSSTFYVASNTAFNIDAALANPVSDTSEALRASLLIEVDIRGDGTVPFGTKAQYPHTGGARGGLPANTITLADLRQSTRVFTGNQRTAKSPGSIAEQSVRFTMSTQNTIGAESKAYAHGIVYTVFIP